MATNFEWDEDKAARNIRDHDGVSFERATLAFDDKFCVEWIDDREDYGEERVVLLGMIQGQTLACDLHGTRQQYPHHLRARSDQA